MCSCKVVEYVYITINLSIRNRNRLEQDPLRIALTLAVRRRLRAAATLPPKLLRALLSSAALEETDRRRGDLSLIS